MPESPNHDGQDGAETLDTFLDDDGVKDAGLTFEELPEVEDLTQFDGDTRDVDPLLPIDDGPVDT
jgi:hypothetical protein